MISFGQSQRRGQTKPGQARQAGRQGYTRRQGSMRAASYLLLLYSVLYACVWALLSTGVTLGEGDPQRESLSQYGLPGLPAVDFAVKTTRFMLCIESSPDNKMFADAYKAALPHPDPKSESGVSAWASFAR